MERRSAIKTVEEVLWEDLLVVPPVQFGTVVEARVVWRKEG